MTTPKQQFTDKVMVKKVETRIYRDDKGIETRYTVTKNYDDTAKKPAPKSAATSKQKPATKPQPAAKTAVRVTANPRPAQKAKPAPGKTAVRAITNARPTQKATAPKGGKK